MKTRLTVKPNGSLLVEGDFEIVDIYGNVYGIGDRTAVSICRCGLSNKMPFCDSTHKGNFIDDAKAYDLPPKKTNL